MTAIGCIQDTTQPIDEEHLPKPSMHEANERRRVACMVGVKIENMIKIIKTMMILVTPKTETHHDDDSDQSSG